MRGFLTEGVILTRTETYLPGVFVIEVDAFTDARGSFTETYRRDKYRRLGIHDDFVQDNFSRSVRGVLRGLHYQLEHPQAKLCWVAEGNALDVAVDIRRGSPTFGRWVTVVLSAATGNQFYIPAGFAHGFLALTDPVLFMYKCGDFYVASDDYGIAWNDPNLQIPWGVSSPLMSEKDLRHPFLSHIAPALLPRYVSE